MKKLSSMNQVEIIEVWSKKQVRKQVCNKCVTGFYLQHADLKTCWWKKPRPSQLESQFTRNQMERKKSIPCDFLGPASSF